MRLFRFENADSFRIDTLRENKLWMSLPDSFNDPFDCDLNLSFKSSLEEDDDKNLKEAVLKLYKNHKPEETYWFFDEDILRGIITWADGTDQIIGPPKFVEKIKERIKSFGLQCFSEIFDNPLMWGYYASGHKGFCIEYECSHNHVAMYGNGKVSLDQIVYMSILPEYNVSEVILSPHEFQRRLYSTKSYHWSHEKEHRLITFDLGIEPGATGGKIDLPNGIKVTGIYAGLKCKLLKELTEAAKSISVPLNRMIKTDSYQMSYEKIEF